MRPKRCFPPRHCTGPATIFVSHAWKYRFADVLEALEAFELAQLQEEDLVREVGGTASGDFGVGGPSGPATAGTG